MSNKIFIYGAGGLGIEVVDILARSYQDEITIKFVDDYKEGQSISGIEVTSFSTLIGEEMPNVVIAQGDPHARQKLYQKIKPYSMKLMTVIDPSAIVSSRATIADGAIICPHTIVASQAKIGLNSLINAKAIIGHDVVIGEHTVISSMVNIGGETKLGALSFIGMGALIREKLNIESNVIISMGAVLHTDLPASVIAVGNPARVSRKNENKAIFKRTTQVVD